MALNSFQTVVFSLPCSRFRFFTRASACLTAISLLPSSGFLSWFDSNLLVGSSLLSTLRIEVNMSSLRPDPLLCSDFTLELQVILRESYFLRSKQSKQKDRLGSGERFDLRAWPCRNGSKGNSSRERLDRIDLSSPLCMLPIDFHISLQNIQQKLMSSNYLKRIQIVEPLPFSWFLIMMRGRLNAKDINMNDSVEEVEFGISLGIAEQCIDVQ